MVAQDFLELVSGRGIVGDRFFDWKADYKGQITFIDSAVIDEVRKFVGNPELPPTAFRRNVVIRGVDLNSLVASSFMLGGIHFDGAGECSPCYWMDEACGLTGVEELMKGRGGLRCRIRSDGQLRPCEMDLVVSPS